MRNASLGLGAALLGLFAGFNAPDFVRIDREGRAHQEPMLHFTHYGFGTKGRARTTRCPVCRKHVVNKHRCLAPWQPMPRSGWRVQDGVEVRRR